MPDGNVSAKGSTRDAIREFFASEARNALRIEKFNRGLTDDDELPPYVHQDYPKALYAPDGESIVVKSAAEERTKVAEGYFASLAEFEAALESLPEEYEESATPARGPGGRFLKKGA